MSNDDVLRNYDVLRSFGVPSDSATCMVNAIEDNKEALGDRPEITNGPNQYFKQLDIQVVGPNGSVDMTLFNTNGKVSENLPEGEQKLHEMFESFAPCRAKLFGKPYYGRNHPKPNTPK